MSYRKQSGYMWGCRVVWGFDECDNAGWHEEWMFDTTARDEETGECYYPMVFTETREEIMRLVRDMRKQNCVKSAVSVKVPIPKL